MTTSTGLSMSFLYYKDVFFFLGGELINSIGVLLYPLVVCVYHET